MFEWNTIIAGTVSTCAALWFLKLAADAVGRSEAMLQLLERQEKKAAEKRPSPSRPGGENGSAAPSAHTVIPGLSPGAGGAAVG